jgi:short-subunit dehydrogenase
MGLLLRGKSVLITGASRGVGAATVKAFAEKGSDLHRLARETAGVDILVNNARDIPGGPLEN